MQLTLNLKSTDDYRLFLRIKSLPRYSFNGRVATVPDEYAGLIGLEPPKIVSGIYKPHPKAFDYQRDVSGLMIRKQKFAAFIEPGRGKTLIMFEVARHAREVLPPRQRCLLVAPLMVIRQHLKEAAAFYPDMRIERVPSAMLAQWLATPGGGIGITNYEAFSGDEDLTNANLGLLALDESSLLKSHYGKWGTRIIDLGRGVPWKFCFTGTPAPNDRIEYANHAVFLDQFPTVNSFLARFFVNRGQTDNRWELKAHALKPFYTALSHWCIFMSNPATYGWKDGTDAIPPINVHIHDVPLTAEQLCKVSRAGGDMFGTPGGITSRSKLSQLAKGRHDGAKIATNKPAFIKSLVDGFGDESTLIWCLYNAEQDGMADTFPDAANISGDTPQEDREKLIGEFQDGKRKVVISKSKIMGFGLNLQIATRQVFSGLMDSYESYFQCVKRSNRIGSKFPLNVHIPVTDVERPMIETVLSKAARVQADTDEQERTFKEIGYAGH